MRNRIFWGAVLIILGLIFLFSYQMGFSIWSLIWPFAIIVVGCWILLIPFLSRGIEIMKDELSFPLEGVNQATIKIEHGAGTINLTAADLPDKLLTGSFLGGVKSMVSSSEGKCRIKLQSKVEFINFLPRFQKEQRLIWDLSVNRTIPLKIKMETGASDNHLDLRGSKLKELHLETGASTSELFLPEDAGEMKIHIESGASTIKIHVPQNVVAKIKVGGLIGKTINTDRFQKIGDLYQSADFENVKNRAEIEIESGVGSIEIN
ncbi:MAG: hypothetical protein C4545_05510 [Anaerolineaceae bacterium]|jgi:hypothetical protein|nr:MAG: hypothetical protein C4545_05510 [Anaerolineaceae bacterium]